MVSVTGEMLLTAKGATLVSRLKVASTAPPPVRVWVWRSSDFGRRERPRESMPSTYCLKQ